jgi:hypothetical protein
MREKTKIKNTFGGVVTDVANSVVPANMAVGMENVRVYSPDGDKSFIATYVKGSEKKFSITEGYTPIRTKSFNGVLFIFSVKVIDDSFVTEIGCFPSPNYYNPILGLDTGFQEEYSPLMNYTAEKRASESGSLEQEFRSSQFNMNLETNLDISFYGVHDNTVDIYFMDHTNPMRVINSGFDLSGNKVAKRLYSNYDFKGKINMVLYTDKIMTGRATGRKTTGGVLNNGVYSVYARYVTAQYDRTQFFLLQSGIYVGKGASNELANESIEFLINNIDKDFNKIEIGFVRKFDNTFEAFIVNQYYRLGTNKSNITIDITGLNVITAISEDFISSIISHDIPKTATIFRNRIWPANLKKSDNHNDYLKKFASLIQLKPERMKSSKQSIVVDGYTLEEPSINVIEGTDFKGYYHAGEIYCAGLQFQFTSARESDPYPCRGGDFFDQSNIGIDINNTGIIRFPKNTSVLTDITQAALPFKLKIDGSDLWSWINSSLNIAAKKWFEANIQSITIVRAERKPFKITQAVLLKGYHTDHSKAFSSYNPNPNISAEQWEQWDNYSNNEVPLINLPNQNWKTSTSDVHHPAPSIPVINSSFSSVYSFLNRPQTPLVEGSSAGLFSFDICAGKQIEDNTEIFIDTLYEFHAIPDSSAGVPSDTSLRLKYVKASSTFRADYSASKVNVWSTQRKNNMVGFVNQGDMIGYEDTPNFVQPGGHLGYMPDKAGTVVNFAMGFNPFFAVGSAGSIFTDPGLNTAVTGGEKVVTSGAHVVNVYPSNPIWIDAFNWYVFKNERFYKISEALTVKDFATDILIRNGDCFYNEGSITIFGNPQYDPTDDIKSTMTADEQRGRSVQGAPSHPIFRLALRLRLESDYNQKHFYSGPASTEPGIQESYLSSASTRARQSFRYNDAFSDLLPLSFYYGYNGEQPETSYQLQTRVAYSNKTNNSSIRDWFRVFDLSSKEDYSHQFGQINRIGIVKDFMIIVLDKAVLSLVVDQQTTVPSETGQVLVGTGSVLNERYNPISVKHGSQHFNGVLFEDHFCTGIDVQERVIWFFSKESGFEVITESKHNVSEITAFFNASNASSNKSAVFSDSPTGKEGMTISYDNKYKEVLYSFRSDITITLEVTEVVFGLISVKITDPNHVFLIRSNANIQFTSPNYEGYFILSGVIPITQSETDGQWYALFTHSIGLLVSSVKVGTILSSGLDSREFTLVYSEAKKEFCGNRSSNARVYGSINNNFYSSNPDKPEEFWIHNVDGKRGNFFGVQGKFEITFIVNDPSDIEKIFHTHHILSAPLNFDYIKYETLEQASSQIPFITDETDEESIFLEPKYTKEGWNLPVNRSKENLSFNADVITSNIGSRMKGSWMKVTIGYTGSLPNFIKSVRTGVTKKII